MLLETRQPYIPSRTAMTPSLRTLAMTFLTMLSCSVRGDFTILALTANNSHVVEHNAVTGDDRGGIAGSPLLVLYTGDSSTARFGVSDLSGGTALGQVFDALVGDLRSQTIYSLGNGTVPLTNGGGIVTTLLEHDGVTGQLTGSIITLSEPIFLLPFGTEAGIFAGYGRVVVHAGSHVYEIALPSGVVTDLGTMPTPLHQETETWAYWGLAERIGNITYLAYVRDRQTIVRTRVPDGDTSIVATFTDLSDMAAFTVSVPESRWYFHHESSSQFGGGLETLGFADAAFLLPESASFPVILTQPQNQSATSGETVSFFVLASASPPVTGYQWFRNGNPIANATNSVLSITNVQPTDVGFYTVVASNVYGGRSSTQATLRHAQSPVQYFNLDRVQVPATGNDGRAIPYASTNRVSGMIGTLERVEVSLSKIAHTWPGDLHFLLIGPGGQRAVLLAGAGGSADVTNLDLTLSDQASFPAPSGNFLTSGTYRPSDYRAGVSLPAPAPSRPYSSDLSVFSGTDPNGDWQLLIYDEFSTADGGSLSGWSLNLYPATPFNDNFENALPLTNRSISTQANNRYATQEIKEPNHAAEGGQSLWWTWNCTTDGQVTMDTLGSSLDTLLAVYLGDTLTNLTLVEANDDADLLHSRVSFTGLPGRNYRIAVDGYRGAHGNIVLNIVGANPMSPLVIFCPSDFTVNSFSDVPNPDPDSAFVQSSCGAVTRSFLGQVQLSSGCESFIDRTYQVVDSCQQTNTCTQRITVRSRPEIFNVSISEAVQSDGYHVSFCASVSGSNLSYEWTVDSQNTVFNFNNCFEAVFPTLDEATHTIGLIVRNPCGFDGTTTPPITTCSACLSRGSPNLLTGNSGGGFGPEIANAPCGTIGGGALWYKLVAYDAGNVTISTEGSPSDTLLTVFTGSLLFGQFNAVTCNDNVSAANQQSRVNFSAEQGQIYWIAVDPRTSSPNIRLAIGYQPRIEIAHHRADGTFELRSSVVPAMPFQVQAATSLSPGETDWSTVLVTNPSPAFPYVHYLEASNTNYTRRFFRLAPGP